MCNINGYQLNNAQDNWNAFGCDVSETLLLQTADLIVDYGLKDLGYHYVILDDCWSAGRNASNNNSLVADSISSRYGGCR
jgi:alpha-galactosidase